MRMEARLRAFFLCSVSNSYVSKFRKNDSGINTRRPTRWDGIVPSRSRVLSVAREIFRACAASLRVRNAAICGCGGVQENLLNNCSRSVIDRTTNVEPFKAFVGAGICCSVIVLIIAPSTLARTFFCEGRNFSVS
jgi:hypothetical protein